MWWVVPATLPSEKRGSAHFTGVWVGSSADLGGCGKSRSHRDSIPGPSSLYRLRYPGPLSLLNIGKFPLKGVSCFRKLRNSVMVHNFGTTYKVSQV